MWHLWHFKFVCNGNSHTNIHLHTNTNIYPKSYSHFDTDKYVNSYTTPVGS